MKLKELFIIVAIVFALFAQYANLVLRLGEQAAFSLCAQYTTPDGYITWSDAKISNLKVYCITSYMGTSLAYPLSELEDSNDN